MKKVFIWMVLVILGLVGLVSCHNQFDMVIKEEQVKVGSEELAIEYAQPKGDKKKPGLVLFIHGDGPATKNSDEGYYPAWEVLAQENMISLSWDKPGVGDSTGNWLEQDMDDRKAEAEKVLEWALANLEIDPERVGVWGASQGGWVISKLLKDNEAIKFGVGVAPAVNWMRQGRFNTISEMTYQGESKDKIAQKLAKESQINEYLKADDYQGYLKSGLEQEVLSEERWGFIRKNMGLDNTEELKEIAKPYYLILGDHDINVDTNETEEIYRQSLPKEYLTVYRIPEATHRMLKPRHQKDSIMTVLDAIYNPREIFSPAYFEALKEIASKQS